MSRPATALAPEKAKPKEKEKEKKKEIPAKQGSDSKCPACASPIDAEAYHCASCHANFCWRCRKRVPKEEKHTQCANPECKCHGKLLCRACTVLTPIFENVREPFREIVKKAEPTISGVFFKCLLAAVPLFVFFYTWLQLHWVLNYSAAVGGTVLLVLAFLGWHTVKFHKGPIYKQVDRFTRKQTGQRRCCVSCQQPTEEL